MKMINKITIKNMFQNKKRVISTIVATSLICMLMYMVGLIGSTYREENINTAIEEYGDYHIAFTDVNYDMKKYLDQNIESILTTKEVTRTNDYSVRIIIEADDNYLNRVTLTVGRLPQNNKEIIISINDYKYSSYQLNDIITINDMEYKIVGKYQYIPISNQNNISYSFISYFTPESTTKVNFYVKYYSIKNCVDNSKELIEKMGGECTYANGIKNCTNLEPNDKLLSMYGEGENYINEAETILIIMLISFVISVFSVFVIYNSFAISVIERKKAIGILSSIGASPIQIIVSAFLEGIIVYILSNILGFLLSISLMSILINLFSALLYIEATKISIYPIFIMIPLFVSAITIFFASFSSAIRASEITPIEAITLTDDIKIKKRRLKTNKLLSKLFGIEGDIALKNIKRNNKKYRITLISLILAVTTFTSFYVFGQFYLKTQSADSQSQKSDIAINVYASTEEELTSTLNRFLMKPSIDESAYYTSVYKRIKLDSNIIADDIKAIIEPSTIRIIYLDRTSYNKYKKEIGLLKDQPVFINQISFNYYNNDINEFSKNYTGKITTQDIKKINIFSMMDEQLEATYENLYVTSIYPKLIDEETITLILPLDSNDILNNEFQSNYNYGYTIMINSTKWKNYEKSLFQSYYKNIKTSSVDLKEVFDITGVYNNNKKENEIQYNSILVVKIAIYTFCGLVMGIAITSMINTINSNMTLRKKEFVVLRSIGMTGKNFNKMISLESIFLSLKAIIIGNILGISISYIFFKIVYFAEKLESSQATFRFTFPTKAVVISSVLVFTITLLIMYYATKKVKNDNIADILKEDSY